MLNDNGIAWMIAGGQRAESVEDQRQVRHRIAVAEGRPSRVDQLLHVRQRIAAIVGGRDDQPSAVGTLSADCCPA